MPAARGGRRLSLASPRGNGQGLVAGLKAHRRGFVPAPYRARASRTADHPVTAELAVP